MHIRQTPQRHTPEPSVFCSDTSEPIVFCSDTVEPYAFRSDTSEPNVFCSDTSEPSVLCSDSSVILGKRVGQLMYIVDFNGAPNLIWVEIDYNIQSLIHEK